MTTQQRHQAAQWARGSAGRRPLREVRDGSLGGRSRVAGRVMAQQSAGFLATGRGRDGPGPLTRKVLDYTQTMKRLVPKVAAPADWAPLAEFVAVDDFERVGSFLEVQDWPRYTEMLTCWASATSSFETTVRRASELPGLVYFEIEERHHRGDHVTVINSMTVFAFDDDRKIRQVNVYLQQQS